MLDDSGRTGWVVIYLKGVCMGAADSVPGVSGGTIALITGIYERLIAAVTAVSVSRVVSVAAVVLPGRRAQARRAFVEMDGVFLVTLVTGIMTAVVLLTRVLSVGIDQFPVATYGFFFGLIAASAVVLASDVGLDTAGQVAAALAGVTLAYVASGQAGAALESSLPVTVLAGSVAISAMILPGVSGSLLLVILGQYEHMVESLHAFINAGLGLLVGGDVVAVVEPATTVVAFVGGAFVGLFTIAHAVRWALDHYHEATLAFLVSLIVGALRAPIVKVGAKLAADGRAWTTDVLLVFAVAGLVGAALVFLLEHYTEGVEY
jgi:putative membrane protein